MESDTIDHQHPPPDLWQILHGPQTQDGPELQVGRSDYKYGRQHKTTTLNFGADNWNDVIQRGYSWTDFESFITQRECVYVGPFWISNFKIQVNRTESFMKLGNLYLARNFQQTDHSDDDTRSLFLPFLKLLSLHSGNKACSIYSQAKWWVPVIQNESGILLDYLIIHQHDHIDATALHLAAARTKYLHLHDCNMVSTTSTPYPLSTNRFTNNRLRSLRLYGTKCIDTDLLASFIQECTALESFGILCDNKAHGLHFTSDQWMALMEVCSACKTLTYIDVRYVKVESNVWLPGLELLMRSQSLSHILYILDSYETPTQLQTIPYSLKVSRTNAIAQALMCNKTITRLSIAASEIHPTTYQLTVPPMLCCNKLWKNIKPFCREMDDTRDSTQLLGCLLSHRLLHRNPSFLFELVCKVNHQLLHMWHDGRHRPTNRS